MKYTRREFLRRSGYTLGAAAFASRLGMLNALAGSGPDYKALVFIYLDGGNDGCNTVVPLNPTDYASYAAARPSIALTQSQLLAINPLSDPRPYGLHPSMPEMQALWNQKNLGVVCNIGTLITPTTVSEYNSNPSVRPLNLFSHSDQQRAVEFLASSTDGWGYSVGSMVKSFNSAPKIPMMMNVGSATAFYLAGSDPYITLKPGSTPTLSGFMSDAASTARYNALRQIQGLGTNSALVRVMSDDASSAIDQGQLVSSVLGNVTLATPFPANGSTLGPQLLQIAQIIKMRASLGQTRRQVFFASAGGYDTHSGQVSAHQALLTDLSQSMLAFYNATVELGVASSVTTFTLSEFGRTIQNSGDGSDHAWGGHSFVMGGAVKGGDFYGKYPSLVLGGPDDIDQGANARGRILPTTSVDQMAATLAKWYGLDANAVQTAVPNIVRFSTSDLGFMQA